VRIDGLDLRELEQKSLYDQISFVLQDNTLFHAPIWQNIAYGKPDATREEVRRAAELGKSERQVRRDVKRLESVRLIKPRHRDGRKSNTYVLLFHPWFEGAYTSGQVPCDGTKLERPPVSAQMRLEEPGCPVATGHSRPLKPNLSGHARPANQEEFNHKEDSSSSSSQDNGRLKEHREQTESEKTMKERLLRPEHRPANLPPWWTPKELDEAAGVIKAFSNTGCFWLNHELDVGTSLAIMPYKNPSQTWGFGWNLVRAYSNRPRPGAGSLPMPSTGHHAGSPRWNKRKGQRHCRCANYGPRNKKSATARL